MSILPWRWTTKVITQNKLKNPQNDIARRFTPNMVLNQWASRVIAQSTAAKVKLRANNAMKPGTHFCIFKVS